MKTELSLKPITMCDALCDLVPFSQFQKHEKHLWKSATFNKVTVNLLECLKGANVTPIHRKMKLLIKKFTSQSLCYFYYLKYSED